MESKGVLAESAFFPEHSEISGCMAHESSLSVGNFRDLYRGARIPPKLCFVTPRYMTAKGQIQGAGRTALLFIFPCNLLPIVVLTHLASHDRTNGANEGQVWQRLTWVAACECANPEPG